MPKPFKSDKLRTTIPFVPMLCISFVSFLDNFCYSLINPNIPYMCQMYFPDITNDEIGFYSGWIVASYALGGIPGNFFWGWFADRYGRRLSICCSIIGVVITMNVFGLARDFWSAFISRMLWGFLNGNLGIAKTYISEICNDNTQTLGFSIFQTIGGISSTIGPTVGGFLSMPEQNMSALTKKWPILKDYRYYIPCLAGSLICFFVFLTSVLLLPETLSKEDVKQNMALMKKSTEGMKHLHEKRARDPMYKPTQDERMQEILVGGSYFRLITNKPIFMSVLLYGMLSLVQGAQDAVLPVWCVATKQSKGFEWDQSDVGMLYSLLGPIQMIAGHILTHIMCKFVFITLPMLNGSIAKLTTMKNFWLISGFMFMVVILISPICALTIYSPSWIQWLVIYVVNAFSMITRILQFTAIIVMISNVSFPDFRGRVNGIGQVFASIGRFIGPTIATNMYAWSISSKHIWPFDFGFVFYFFGIVQLCQTLLIKYLDDRANHSTPCIRDFVALEMAGHETELKTIKDGAATSNDEVEHITESIAIAPE